MRIIALLFATVCAAANLGSFEGDSGIAETQKPGSVEFNAASGEYKVTGAGGDMWGTARDGFHDVWRRCRATLRSRPMRSSRARATWLTARLR